VRKLIRWYKFGELVLAIDLSEDGPRVIALIGAEEHVLKTASFLRATRWVRHFREIGSDRKRAYLSLIPKRLEKVKPFLEIIKIHRDVDTIQVVVKELKPILVIVDDKLYSKIQYFRKVKESRVKERHRKKLILIADNLANYFRMLLKNNPKKFKEELKRFEK